MRLTLITPAAPPFEELVLPDARAYLRIDGAAEDAVIAQCLAAARLSFEGRDGTSGRALLTQTWEWALDRFPAAGPLEPPLAPLQSVDSIIVRGPDGLETPWPAGAYEVDPGDGLGRVQPKAGGAWPPVGPGLSPIRVRFLAGYGATLGDLPAPLQRGLIGLATLFYTSRDAAIPAPPWIENLLQPYRLVRV